MKVFLSLVSLRGIHLAKYLTWNKGELLEPEVVDNTFLSAETGQRGEVPNKGTLSTLILFCLCFFKVLDHLIIMSQRS